MTAPDDLTARGDAVYERLFGSKPDTDGGPDPELMAILRRVIFGDVFAIGELDDRRRELITVTVLAALQRLPQLRAHTQAALNVGCTPVEIREAMYQLSPFLGFPRTLNAVGAVNETFQARGIDVPLEKQGTVEVADRYDAGREIQDKLYGDEIAAEFTGRGDIVEAVPRLLTEFVFGDFETRGGMDVADRELLLLCALVALGRDAQVAAHLKGCRKAGVAQDAILASLVHCIPYVGFPPVLAALRLVKDKA